MATTDYSLTRMIMHVGDEERMKTGQLRLLQFFHTVVCGQGSRPQTTVRSGLTNYQRQIRQPIGAQGDTNFHSGIGRHLSNDGQP